MEDCGNDFALYALAAAGCILEYLLGLVEVYESVFYPTTLNQCLGLGDKLLHLAMEQIYNQ